MLFVMSLTWVFHVVCHVTYMGFSCCLSCHLHGFFMLFVMSLTWVFHVVCHVTYMGFSCYLSCHLHGFFILFVPLEVAMPLHVCR